MSMSQPYLDARGAFLDERLRRQHQELNMTNDDKQALASIDVSPQEAFDITMGVSRLVRASHGASVKAGWYTDRATGQPLSRNRAEMIALMHSELSEALEGERKGLQDDHLPHRPSAEVELADCVIRICDYAGAWGYDLAGAILEKLAYNAQRRDHTLEARREAGGKAF